MNDEITLIYKNLKEAFPEINEDIILSTLYSFQDNNNMINNTVNKLIDLNKNQKINNDVGYNNKKQNNLKNIISNLFGFKQKNKYQEL